MKSWILAGLAIATFSSVCSAEETSRTVKKTEWVASPSAELAARYYPDRAQRMEVSGRAIVDCGVAGDGKFQDCRVISESPTDYGFGDSAIKLARFMQVAPLSKKDIRKGRTRRIIPVVFSVPYDQRFSR